jgi:hypothetical protein
MRRNFARIIVSAAACAALIACERDAGENRVASTETDSGAIVSAAAEAIVASLRETTLSDTAPQRRWVLAPGPSRWDTMLIDELRRAEPSIGENGDDSAIVTTVSTHGYSANGDTIDVTVVVRSCSRADSLLNFTKDSQIHRLVRTDTTSDTWRPSPPVRHEHAVGECDPLPLPEFAPAS